MSTNRHHNAYREEAPRRQPQRQDGSKRRKAVLHNLSENTRAADERREKKQRPPLTGDMIELEDVPVPSYLTSDQRAIFGKILPVVLELKYLKRSDIFLVTELCGFYAQYVDLCEIVADEGMLIEEMGRNGPVRKVHPLLAQRDKMFRTFLTLAAQFGFTPASRKRMMAAVAKETENEVPVVDPEEQEWDDLLH